MFQTNQSVPSMVDGEFCDHTSWSMGTECVAKLRFVFAAISLHLVLLAGLVCTLFERCPVHYRAGTKRIVSDCYTTYDMFHNIWFDLITECNNIWSTLSITKLIQSISDEELLLGAFYSLFPAHNLDWCESHWGNALGSDFGGRSNVQIRSATVFDAFLHVFVLDGSWQVRRSGQCVVW